MTAFYNTATGQKVLNTMPELFKKQSMIGAKLAEANSDELKRMIEEYAKLIEERMKE